MYWTLLACCVLAGLAGATPTNEDHPKAPASVVCPMPPKSGTCLAMIRRWFYNPETSQCEQFVYGGCGGNENRFLSRESCESYCRRPAARYPDHCAHKKTCRMRCQFGFKTGEDGCPICRCKSRCENKPICPMLCASGFQKGDDGCDICKCKEWPEGKVEVKLSGKGKEANEVVSKDTVAKGPCQKKMACYNLCPFGRELDRDGCESCRCKAKQAREFAFYGRRMQNRREILPTQAKQVDLKASDPKEPCQRMAICLNLCPFGRELDKDGCESCKCKIPKPICDPEPACDRKCLFGYENDRFGCPSCTCKKLPEVCRNRRMCLMYCPNGYVTDSDGCPTCHCKPRTP